jgi:FKBP-type peptidyl-prolyl cis-trans isomerase (trigger factor)
LVKGLGEDISTVADLRSRIRENLEAREAQTLQESLEEKVVSELVERSTIEVAPLMIEHEAEHVLRDQQNALAQYNISLDQFLAQTGQSSEELVNNAKETAANRVKRTLVMDLLAESEGIEPTDTEIDEEIEAWRSRPQGGPNPDPHGPAETDYDSEDTRKAVVAVLKRRKAVERAIEIAKSKPIAAKPAAKKRTKAKAKKTDETSAAEADQDADETADEASK